MERLKILNFISDTGGCYAYRCRIPLDALMQYGVVWQPYTFLPQEINNPNSFEVLCSMVSSYNLVIISRCYLYPVVEKVRQACTLLGVPLVYETDDDYLSLIPSNPSFMCLARQDMFTQFTMLQHEANKKAQQGDKIGSQDLIKKAQEMVPALMESRKQGVEDYKQILRMVDGVTTSTQELAATIYPYNKNVQVFPNHVQFCYPWRLEAPESAFIHIKDNGEKGVQIVNRLGMFTIPKFAIIDSMFKGNTTQEIRKTPRVGYACTPSHWGEDWDTIKDGLNKVQKKLTNKAWYVMLGDSDGRFSRSLTEDPGRVLSIPSSEYEMYRVNQGNFDIALAPLAPTVFNLCKSPIKFLEAKSWGAAALLPHFQTYLRAGKDGDTCLFYRNENEFCEKLELLITNSSLREEIGRNALKDCIENDLSWLEKNSYPRYQYFKSMVDSTPKLRIHVPNKGVVVDGN